MNKYKFTQDHYWITYENNKIIKLGITNYAQKNLGDIVYIEPIPLGKYYSKKEIITNIESVKSNSEIYTPISGEIIEFNKNLIHNPELINLDPYQKGWIVKIKTNEDNVNTIKLMSYKIYQNFINK